MICPTGVDVSRAALFSAYLSFPLHIYIICILNITMQLLTAKGYLKMCCIDVSFNLVVKIPAMPNFRWIRMMKMCNLKIQKRLFISISAG